MLKLEYCRERQSRLLRVMEDEKLEVAILGNPKTIYYFTGALVDPTKPQAFVVAASGRSLLVTNTEPAQCLADHVQTYTAYTIERLLSQASIHAELATMTNRAAALVPGPVGIEIEFVTADIAESLEGRRKTNLTPALMEMRRRKDPDEIESIRTTTAITEAGYAAIRKRIAPGMTEYEAYSIIHEAMVSHAGTSVELHGDFACGTRVPKGGGAPTRRKLKDGDLFILDLFPVYEGYVCDLTRTFAATKPTALQQQAWSHIQEAQTLAQKLIRPGVACREVYEQVRIHLEKFEPARGSFYHHAGHGVGMDGWEYPWLTPGSDQVIQEGEVLACEPGLYSEELSGGIRLEHNYLVGKDGVTALDSFPMDL